VLSGVGQTEAAQHLCTNIPADMRAHYVQPKVGHYGVFNGSRFRAEIAPRISDFVSTHDQRRRRAAATPDSTAQPAPATEPARKATAAPARAAAPADELTRIDGIGPKLAARLNAAGITRLSQIARLTAKQATALDTSLALKGRIAREGWIDQAKRLIGPKGSATEA
jgi:poly(3-hydroxybutyrate) depolymerase